MRKTSILYFIFSICSIGGFCEQKASFPKTEQNEIPHTSDYKAQDYSYLLGKLTGINDQLLTMHFKLYEGYVKNTNTLFSELNTMIHQGGQPSLTYMALKRRVGWEYDGMILHELYFENLGGKQALSQTSPLYKSISRDFGSFEKWRQDFISTGLIRGIGWVILYEDPNTGRLFNIWINEHDLGHLVRGKPLLIMDVWEHAYLTEYGLNREAYIKAFLQNVNWAAVESRFMKK